jgi:hypothetical protein
LKTKKAKKVTKVGLTSVFSSLVNIFTLGIAALYMGSVHNDNAWSIVGPVYFLLSAIICLAVFFQARKPQNAVNIRRQLGFQTITKSKKNRPLWF